MAHTNERPPSANGSLSGISFLAGDTSKNKPPAHVAQAKTAILLDDLADNIGLLISTLRCSQSMLDAGDAVGLVYSLRRSKAYWRAISANAQDLVAIEGDRLSALRQESGQ